MADPDDRGQDDDADSDWFERAIRDTDDETDEAIDEESDDEIEEGGDRSSDAPPADDTQSDESAEDADERPDERPPEQPATPEEQAEAFGFETDPEEGDDFGSDFSEAFDEPGESPETAFGMDLDDPGSGGESFGFDLDDGSADAGETFDDEEFESAIPRIDLGIQGLDEMVQGGVPERSLIVAIGGAGTGKTTFGIQFLAEALEDGDQAVFITLEESHDRILQSAAEKGWDFEEYESDGQLAILDIDPVEMANSLTSIRTELPRLIESFDASRLVLDSVSLLEMMYDEQATRRTEIYDFTRALKEAGVTTMLTSEADPDNDFASRHGIIEYLTDAVFVLRHVRPEDFRETRLAIEIQKIRDANHSRETKPYEITDSGISVYRQANIF